MRGRNNRLLPLLLSLCLMLGLAVFVSPSASAEDIVIPKILTTLSAPETPVALMDSASLYVQTSTAGISVTGAGWFDAAGKAFTGAFEPETYKLEINLKADNGYVISSEVAAYLNNSAVNIQVKDSGKTAVIVREYTAAIWAPTIIKNPKGETVKEGGWASFSATANYARGYEWFLEDPDGRQAVSVSDLHLSHPEMSATGDGSTKVNLYNIPYYFNGWKVVCNFIGAGTNNSVKSQGALLTVIPVTSQPAGNAPDASAEDLAAAGNIDAADSAENADAAPAEASPEVQADDADAQDGGSSDDAGSDVSDVDADTAAAEMPSTVPDPVFLETWSSDARGHWHASETGDQRADEALHSFVWQEAEDGSQTGICDVCGYTRTLKADGNASAAGSDGNGSAAAGDASGSRSGSAGTPGVGLILLMALAPVDVALVAAHAVRSRRKSA